MNITRLFVMGDSIEYQRMISFFHLLGDHNPKIHKHLYPGNRLRDETNITCPMPLPSIRVVFHRVNHLMPLLGNATVGVENVTAYAALSQQEQQRYLTQRRMKREGLDAERIEYFVCGGKRKPQYPGEDGNCPWVEEYLSLPTNSPCPYASQHRGRCYPNLHASPL